MAIDVATGSVPLTEAALRQLQKASCEGQDSYQVLTEYGWQSRDVGKGEYKLHPNHVPIENGSTHSYSPVAEVQQEMHRLVER